MTTLWGFYPMTSDLLGVVMLTPKSYAIIAFLTCSVLAMLIGLIGMLWFDLEDYYDTMQHNEDDLVDRW